MIHIHARTPDGVPSYEVEDFRAITEAILAEVDDVIVNYSTGAIGVPIEKRIAYLRELRPDVAALNMSSMNYAKYSERRKEFVFKAVFENSFDTIIEFLTVMNELGIRAGVVGTLWNPSRRLLEHRHVATNAHVPWKEINNYYPFAVGLMPPVTPITQDTWSGSDSSPMSISGSRFATCPESKHSCSGRMPSSFIASMNSMIMSNEFSNTALKTKSLRRREYFA